MKLLKTYADRCVRCGACMTACSKAYFKEDEPELSRIRIGDVGSMAQMNVCNQCGACIEVCPTQALERDKNGVVQLRKEKCTSCMMCVESITVFSFPIFLMSSRISTSWFGSRPEVGSSRINTSGLCIMACASPTR